MIVAPCIPVSVAGHHYTESLLSVIVYVCLRYSMNEIQKMPNRGVYGIANGKTF